jgi:hypothetical protein
MEAVKMYHYRWKDQENVVLVHNGVYSAMKKNKILSFASKWMELENIILSEVTCSESQKPHIFSHMWIQTYLQTNNVMKKTGHTKGRLLTG